MVRRIDGLDYRRNADWPTYGWEMGAYRAGLASLKGVAAPEDTVLFAQDSFVLVNAERFAKSMEAWAAAGARSACLLTFDKKIALSAGIVERLKQWVGPSYDQGSNWKGCTFNSFIMSWRDLPKLEKSGLFAPATPDRTDSLALERYFGYVISYASTDDKFCRGGCGLGKKHLHRNDNKKIPRAMTNTRFAKRRRSRRKGSLKLCAKWAAKCSA